MTYLAEFKSLAITVAIAGTLITPSRAAQDDHRTLRHGPPGSVTFDSINALPDRLRQAIAPSALSPESHSAPLLEQDVRPFQNFRDRIAADPAAAAKVGVSLASIQASDLARYDYLGLIPEGPRKEGPWTSLTRVYQRPDGLPVFLFEWDYPADGGSIVVLEEFINEKVGETPARLVVKRAADGRAVSVLV